MIRSSYTTYLTTYLYCTLCTDDGKETLRHMRVMQLRLCTVHVDVLYGSDEDDGR